MQHRSHARLVPGFSLVELLVVIAIIAIVIAIIVPALNGARTAARKAATTNLLSQVTDAAMQFSQDNSGSMPGYFSATDMGGVANMDSRKGGFTMMENVLLDLIGQDAIVGTAGISNGGTGGGGGGSNTKTIGPFGNAGAKGQSDKSNIKVDLDLLGTGDHVYLHAGAANLSAASGQAASTPHQQFPDLVDAFGNPVMAWVEDRSAPREPLDITDFASKDSKTKRARFYFAENFGYLTSTGLGRGGKDQTIGTGKNGSLLNDPAMASQALSAVLGSPNFPLPMDFKDSDVHPGAPRGAFILESAGADGIYLAQRDSGAKALGVDGESAATGLAYKYNFYAGPKRLTDSNGKVASIDLVQGFDDIFQAAGN
ncbi:MAG: prepilin-type N-terminal cleavage/methylation domain-containing protein [Phycisphaerales bacterium]|nr:prepilin-type N-terminal cleavage/methylation domain-containing protein [Phycisphaerales bacterium]